MFLRFLLGAAATLAAGVAVAAAICYVVGAITKEKVQEKMREKNISAGLVSMINNSTNQIKITDMDSGDELTIEGDEISDEIYENQYIYA